MQVGTCYSVTYTEVTIIENKCFTDKENIKKSFFDIQKRIAYLCRAI